MRTFASRFRVREPVSASIRPMRERNTWRVFAAFQLSVISWPEADGVREKDSMEAVRGSRKILWDTCLFPQYAVRV